MYLPSRLTSPSLLCRFFDPGLGNRALRRMERRPRAALTFVEEGKLQKQAEIGRLRVRPLLLQPLVACRIAMPASLRLGGLVCNWIFGC